MEQTDHQNPRSLTQFTRYQFLKKITQLLLSVSVFSFLLSNSSRLSFLHYSSSFSTVPFQLFTHTIDKNCIFLLCNGLLVFVAKFSGLITSPSSSPKNYYNHNTNIDDQSVKNFDYHSLVMAEEKEQLMANKEEDVAEDMSQEEQNEETNHQDDEEESGNGNLTVDEEEKESVEAFGKEDYQEKVTQFDDKLPDLDDDKEQEEDGEDDDFEDEEENGMLSTEELNKKFDEFIRKMKEEIRIEAQQQLVMVN